MQKLRTMLDRISPLARTAIVLLILATGYYLFTTFGPDTPSTGDISSPPTEVSIRPAAESTALEPAAGTASDPQPASSGSGPGDAGPDTRDPVAGTASDPQPASSGSLPTGEQPASPEQPALLPTDAQVARLRPTVERSPVPEDPQRAQHYLSVIQQETREQEGAPETSLDTADGHVRVIKDQDETFTALIVLPLERSETATNAEFVRASQESLMEIVNILITEDPDIPRIGVVGTYPTADGTALPAISIMIRKPEGQAWSRMTFEDLATFEHGTYVRPDLLKP